VTDNLSAKKNAISADSLHELLVECQSLANPRPQTERTGQDHLDDATHKAPAQDHGTERRRTGRTAAMRTDQLLASSESASMTLTSSVSVRTILAAELAAHEPNINSR
jgi:hypothetical protein